jgi:hypothetical protein
MVQTMKAVHTLDQEVIVSRPIVFEGILESLLDGDSSDPVIDSLIEEFIERTSFGMDVAPS